MKTIRLIAILTLIFGNLFSQEDYKRPDYELIKTEITNSDSRFSYPDLYNRFVQNDTTLDKDDYIHLYYGFIYNDKYVNYEDSDDIIDIIRKIDTYTQIPENQLTSSDNDSLFKYTNLILEKRPYNIRDLSQLIYYYHKKGDLDKEKRYLYKAKMIIETILSSGDGKSESSAFHVISTQHEYDILDIKGFQPVMKKLVGDDYHYIKGEFYHYIKVRKNKEKIKGIYFDVTKIFETLMTGN